MKLTELKRKPLEGALNINLFFRTYREVLLQRNPKDTPESRQILKSIAHEYHFLGFTDLGGRFKKRSPEEQAKLCALAASQGLRVLPPRLVDFLGRNYFVFLDQVQTLDEFLPIANESEAQLITYQLLEDLRRAHAQEIIYGDRWSKNILIVPNLGPLHVDFDIEISGRPVKEFDVAQIVYYALCGGREKILLLLANFLATADNWFDLKIVSLFLKRHSIYFRNSPDYGGTESLVDRLISSTYNRKICL